VAACLDVLRQRELVALAANHVTEHRALVNLVEERVRASGVEITAR
jgi:hypothetical protein